ncbi:hypothetical protein D3C79_864980 [compost metagenome]
MGGQAILLLQAICVPKVTLLAVFTYWCFQQCQAFVGGVSICCWVFLPELFNQDLCIVHLVAAVLVHGRMQGGAASRCNREGRRGQINGPESCKIRPFSFWAVKSCYSCGFEQIQARSSAG